MPRPFIIPFFIAHQGCPHICSFCDQHAITGREAVGPGISRVEIVAGIRAGLERPHRQDRQGIQVAFYGGSFTGLPQGKQQELLDAVQPFLANGEVDEIRLSTRPDYISAEIISFLKSSGVTIVELGVQSMNDQVLVASGRGHTVADSELAIGLLQEGGVTVGVQLMIGLPGERTVSVLRGAERLAALRPDLARIYPVVVLKGSKLAEELQAGSYRPLCLPKAVALSGRVKEILDDGGVRVVRTGLQDTDSLQESIVAGPFHPAFGEMVLSRNLFRKVVEVLSRASDDRPSRLRVSALDQSVMRGPGNRNLHRLERRGLLAGVELVFDPDLPRNSVVVDKGQ
jgi:histone acetyltransferase (RNA polymerase elongator complex component)